MLHFLCACTQNCEKAHAREYAQLILTTLRAVVLLIRRAHVVTFWCDFGAIFVMYHAHALVPDTTQHRRLQLIWCAKR